ncbi:MAG: chromosome segregation protein SMC [Butyrivibrio sp.]|nr:chromosome segregation protein SMC [Butyrivibrio sp.]
MYLKRIDVQGFKSFANKLVFEFDNGITGIVGPNGSGKSNIADAVRWVLGEQSAKQLRGAKMEDIIFAGTETRKPVSFAAVSLTIDNSDHQLDIDYDEVTVTRRVFRSGESEYLLNGNNCRLKDINELFYDTGIGKEGYSIIGQGQIDKILSGKPEERRELFDEAAGIVKYKKRKAAAVKNLESENNNLVRINDILAELEKQVGPLAKQSEKAKEYLRLRDILKKYEVNLFLIEHEANKKSIAEVEAKLGIVNHDIDETRVEFEKIKSVYDEKNADIEAISNKIDELNAENSQAEIDKNKLVNHIELLKEQIKSANSNDEHLAERIKAIEDQIAERTEEKSKLLKQKFAMTNDLDDARMKHQESENEVSRLTDESNNLQEEIDRRKQVTYDNLNQIGLIRTNMQRYQTMLEQIGIRKAELNSRLINFKTDESRFDSTISEQQKELDEINHGIDRINEEIYKKAARRNDIREHIKLNEQKLTDAKEQAMRASSRLESLKNIAERYDGYGNSIRKVMEAKDSNPGIVGVVADIVKSEKKYEVAIETALGGTIQNIVTEDEKTAKEMIQYLKENRYGRATFLPLNNVSGRVPKEDLSREKGFIGYASELVDNDSKYDNLVSYLLGRCVVADNIDNAIALNRKYRQSLKIVTLEGELLNPGGSMTGGAFKNSSNLLGRKREIEELEEIIAKTKAAVTSIQEKTDAEKAESAKLLEEVNALNEELQTEKLKLNTAKMKFDQLETRQNEVKDRYNSNKREAEDIEKQIQEINESLSSLKYELAQIEQDNDEATVEIEQMTERMEAVKIELVDRQRIATETNIEYSKITQESTFIEESIKRALRDIDRYRESIDMLLDNKEDSAKEIETKNSEIEQITDTIKLAEEKISAIIEEVATLKNRKEELNTSIKSFFDSREACQEKLVNLEKEQFRLVQQKEKYESAMEGRMDYMWESYEITLNQAAQMRDESINDEKEIKQTVTETKGNIKKLGDVNVNAIEEYKEVAERYEFLKKQHDDLIIATEKLVDVIKELDTGMRNKFTEKFEEIKVEFDKVFKQLFGGGKGTIEIDEEMDILEANISIISQPPGKKLQNMMQLSGGEKALTAICLLFAIQNLKPSPFCLLDEIEAALDDSNVDRYAKYLHNLTKNTQFIVITHRRGTMAAADRLYGITMQEKGVSTLVSVDLVSNQLDEKQKN